MIARSGALFLLALLSLLPFPAFSGHDLQIGVARDIVPRYLLQDANGRATTPEDFRGRYQIITFGYTYCPDICPTTLTELASILQLLGPLAGGVQPIFISVDPERDSPENLKAYTAFFDVRIIGLTGSPALVSRTADNFKVRYQKVFEKDAPLDRYAVDHSAGMFLLGPDGGFLKKFAYATPPGEIAAAIRRQMEEAPARPVRDGRR